jgi:hypothetical protein
MRGVTTINEIILDTTECICRKLQPLFMPTPTSDKWIEMTSHYSNLWNMPNCLGSTDGKHVRVKCFHNSSSPYYNHKGYFSVVLMTSADGL